VGLGLDFMYLEGSDYGFFHAAAGRWPRGYPSPPWHFLQPEQMGALVDELERAGFGQKEIVGILGENYLRLAT
jgi:membrane dipeptidase